MKAFISLFTMLLKDQIFKQLRKPDNFPKLPEVMLKLVKACSNSETSTRELTAIISADPGTASKLLGILRSGYVNFPGEINSIKTAVIYLGTDTIRNIAISSSAMHFFKIAKVLPEFDITTFWFNAYKCGLAARKLAEISDLAAPEEAFLAGLLHDMGRLVLIQNFPDTYKPLLTRHPGTDEAALLNREKEIFNTSTPEVSAWLFKKWALSPLLSDALLYVDAPADKVAKAFPLVKILFMAKKISRLDPSLKLDSPLKGDDIFSLPEKLLGQSIPCSQMEEIIFEAEKETLEMAEALGIERNNEMPKAPESSLASKIKDISLFYGTIQNLLSADTMENICHTIENGLKIIFNVSSVSFFLADTQKELLNGKCSKNNYHYKIIKKIALPLSDQSSIITRSLGEKRILSSLEKDPRPDLTISDSQLIRIMGNEGIMTLPMNTPGDFSGVILLGISEADHQLIFENLELVEMFSKQCALCIKNVQYKREQAEILQSEKIKALTTVTRQTVHEINNPLSIVSNYVKMLGMKLPDRHPAQNELNVINEEIHRIAGLLSSLSTFSEPVINEFEVVDMNKIITALLEIMKTSIFLPRGIEAKFKAENTLPLIKTDPGALKQVLINLLKNSAEALENGGNINVKTRFIPDSEKIIINQKNRKTGKVEIVVQDNGPGIDDAIKDKIFNPYVSTKTADNSGLGLSIVQHIVSLLNGTIHCRSQAEKGTAFTIVLPVSSSRNA
ncbi:MAG: HDOD domain-containing protein [Desulfobacteraceae bacterium]